MLARSQGLMLVVVVGSDTACGTVEYPMWWLNRRWSCFQQQPSQMIAFVVSGDFAAVRFISHQICHFPAPSYEHRSRFQHAPMYVVSMYNSVRVTITPLETGERHLVVQCHGIIHSERLFKVPVTDVIAQPQTTAASTNHAQNFADQPA